MAFTDEEILYLKLLVHLSKDKFYSQYRKREVTMLSWDFIGDLVGWLEGLDVTWLGGSELLDWCNKAEIGGGMPQDLYEESQRLKKEEEDA